MLSMSAVRSRTVRLIAGPTLSDVARGFSGERSGDSWFWRANRWPQEYPAVRPDGGHPRAGLRTAQRHPAPPTNRADLRYRPIRGRHLANRHRPPDSLAGLD